MNLSKVLNYAADLFDGCAKWAQNPGPDNPGLCAATAIQRAVHDLSEDWGRPDKSIFAFAEFLGGFGAPDIFEWNDARGRTVEEVQAALRACAAISDAREREQPRAPAITRQQFVRHCNPSKWEDEFLNLAAAQIETNYRFARSTKLEKEFTALGVSPLAAFAKVTV